MFYSALHLALDEKRLRRIAEKLVKMAEAGVPWSDADGCHRSRKPRHRFRADQSRLGQNRYGWSECTACDEGERGCDQTSDLDIRASPVRKVLQP
jgi:hypothetical protein